MRFKIYQIDMNRDKNHVKFDNLENTKKHQGVNQIDAGIYDRVFMGDTGSLALGGFVASIALMLHMPLYIVIVGLIYLVEVLSVIIQVGYFKLTHGKRIFKMAPIHHHFELSGFSETQVVAAFSIITAILCLIGLMAL